jgi:hypothetical protein
MIYGILPLQSADNDLTHIHYVIQLFLKALPTYSFTFYLSFIQPKADPSLAEIYAFIFLLFT